MWIRPVFPAGIVLLAVAGTAGAHHSRAPYDMTTEVVIEGTVTELDWRNPHISMTVEARGADGAPVERDIEVTSVSEARAMGLAREAIAPGAQVVVRAHPGRNAGDTRAVGIDVTIADGRVFPLNTDAGITLAPAAATEAEGIGGRWAPSVPEFEKSFVTMAQWPFTEAAAPGLAAARASTVPVLGICADYPPPLLSIFPDLREISIGDATVEMRFEAQGQDLRRIVHLDQSAHPANVAPTLLGHSIGHWDDGSFIVDTVAFEPHAIGVMVGITSGPAKHLVERFTLQPDRRHLRYELTLEDPASLTAPANLSVLWDYRPELEPSGVACDPESATQVLGR